jgi:hypothetical protein
VDGRVNALYGYRAWRLKGGQLYSLRSSLWPWLPSVPQQATCYRNFFLGTYHSAPHEGCSCGLYAYKEPPRVDYRYYDYSPMAAAPYQNEVWGVVSLIGKVIVHTKGYRAQQARPVAIAYADGIEEAVKDYGLIVLENLDEWMAA